jgi:hypothetical protein
MIGWRVVLLSLLVGITSWSVAAAEGPSGESIVSPPASEPAASVELPRHRIVVETSASPSRPTWTGGASTSERGELQSDFGWQWLSMGAGIEQWILPTSVRYGLNSRVELRWGLPAQMVQRGGAGGHLKGISDHGLSALYRFHEQGRWVPALAVSYGVKIPTANPNKGFGTGYTDHQLVFIASRDLGRVHFDFNTVGTVAGGPDGHDVAAQYGLALSLPISRRLTWVLDCFGGPQPGTSDRYGAALSGGTWALRPWLVLDAAYTRAYTAGAPREQFTVGITHAVNPGISSAFKRFRVSRHRER